MDLFLAGGETLVELQFLVDVLKLAERIVGGVQVIQFLNIFYHN